MLRMNIIKKYLLVVGGPTCIGKTKVSHKLAEVYNAPIVSADSRQLYREMDIGTAKPSRYEIDKYNYQMIDTNSIHNPITVGEYEVHVMKILDKLFSATDIVILCGGSGLYIDAILFGIDDFPIVPPEIVEKWTVKLAEQGIETLQEQLKKVDPDYYDKVDLNNPRRIIRALGVSDVSGKPYSTFLSGTQKQRNFKVLPIILDIDRSELYNKINQRVDQMMAKGLLEEAKTLYPDRYLKSLQTVGYQELFQYFEGNGTLEEAIRKIKQNSRRYAKRQITWFNRYPDWPRFKPDNVASIQDYINSSALID